MEVVLEEQKCEATSVGFLRVSLIKKEILGQKEEMSHGTAATAQMQADAVLLWSTAVRFRLRFAATQHFYRQGPVNTAARFQDFAPCTEVQRRIRSPELGCSNHLMSVSGQTNTGSEE